jgi:hypothetical protein
LTADPGLYTIPVALLNATAEKGDQCIPDTSHSSPVEDRPERTPDAKRGSGDNRERDVVGCADPTSQADEDSGN